MKKLCWAFSVGALLMMQPRQAVGVVGCLVNMNELIPRADVVVVGHVEAVGDQVVRPCNSEAERNARLFGSYSKCDRVYSMKFVIRETLWGQASTTITVLVPSEPVFSLSCDDRPPVEKMVGLDAILFLESSEGHLWTLEGPNSIYSSWRPIKGKDLRGLKEALAERREAGSDGR